MRTEGARLHPDARIMRLGDRLPGLDGVFRLGASFDLIVLSAVWQHVAPEDRPRAFRKMITLLKPGGTLILNLWLGPPDTSRGMHQVSAEKIVRLAQVHGAVVKAKIGSEDQLGRSEITWTTLVLKLPDDGTGALPPLVSSFP